MKKILGVTLLMFTLLFSIQQESNAQAMGHDYTTGIGIKFHQSFYYGSGGAINAKHFFQPNMAVEGILGIGGEWMSLTGLYEFHGDITDLPGLKWYAGPGAHIGFANPDTYKNAFYLGVDGVLGLDYKINKAPISISLDIIPSLDFPNAYFAVGGGLSIRFTF